MESFGMPNSTGDINEKLLTNSIRSETDMRASNGKQAVPSNSEAHGGSYSNSIPSNFYEKLFEEGKVWTHGYLHGHIHRHKDHTHIHGHIHNHDHDNHNQSVQEIETVDNGSKHLEDGLETCNEFDDFSLCKDIFCDELDDCFYLQCDGTKEEEKIACTNDCVTETLEHSGNQDDAFDNKDGCHRDEVKCCEDPSCLEDSSDSKAYSICNNPACIEPDLPNNSSFDCCNTSESELYNHENNLCGLQMSKKPIFENLISKAHDSLEINADTAEPSLKRQKLPQDKKSGNKYFQVHFPHVCHPTPEIHDEFTAANDQSGLATDHHHIHQSCFHASIPNLDNTEENISNKTPDEKPTSDFDFFIQFNNFKHLLDLSKDNGQEANNKLSMLGDAEAGETDQPTVADSTFPTYSCQWDNCFKTISDGTIMRHVIDQHIGQEYNMNESISKSSDFKPYQCEWNECNYMNTDLNSLIDHLNCHKRNENLFDDNINMLTPSTTDKSNISSPNNPILSQSNPSPVNDINITSIKFSPQKKNRSCCSETIDPYFTCKWQVGVDSITGEPIPCNRTHISTGDLHTHLVDDHIGLGKSNYACNWVGCDRHNGKGFRQRQKLLRHIHIHTNFKPCKCDICGSTFAVDSMLKQHLRIHSGEKPFTCSICGKNFATGSSLSIHNRIHTGEKPLMCKWPGCGKRFSESSNLTKHMKIHLKAFNCEICGEQFDKKTNYTRHMKLHKKADSIANVPSIKSEVHV